MVLVVIIYLLLLVIRNKVYIHSTFQFVNKNETASYYKKLLKEINPINLRRSNKFDVLAVYGACNCMINQNYEETLNIYLASEYGVISGILKVLPTLDNKDNIIMPFDFLNTNGNNAGFNISSALKSKGESILINSNNFSFEQSLKYAYFKANSQNNFETIIGAIDESLEHIENINNILDTKTTNTKDSVSFIYCNNNKENAIAEIKDIKEFSSKNSLNDYINHHKDYNIIIYKENNLSPSTQTASDLINNLKLNSNFILVKYTKVSNFIIKVDFT